LYVPLFAQTILVCTVSYILSLLLKVSENEKLGWTAGTDLVDGLLLNQRKRGHSRTLDSLVYKMDNERVRRDEETKRRMTNERVISDFEKESSAV
jgi:hypothetical protein